MFVGEAGIGKSLTVERLHQSAIARNREDAGAPTPVYLDARDDFGALASAVEAAAVGLGNPHVQGGALVIDSAEDQGGARASELLTQARTLVNTWPQTTVVMAGRPLLQLQEAEETVEVAPLTEEQAWDLVSKHAGYEIRSAWGWPRSIADAVTRPLFAILLGLQLRDRSFWRPKSTGELLSSLSERVVSGKMGPDARAVLERLAVLSTDRGGASVPCAEIGKRADLDEVLKSGLVLERSGSVRFSLPIVEQWYAAQSLARGGPPVRDLLHDARRLEWWRYPLVIVAGTLSHDDVSTLLQPLAASDPGLTAQIVDEGLARWGSWEDAPAAPALEAGRRIRAAMAAWVQGLGPLAPLVAPLTSEGKLRSLGVGAGEFDLTTSWYEGLDEIDEVVELGASLFSDRDPRWRSFYGEPPRRQSAFAWRRTLDELVGELSKLLQNRGLPVEEGPIAHEAAWMAALALTGRGSLDHRPVPVAAIDAALRGLPANTVLLDLSRREHRAGPLRKEVDALHRSGVTELTPPWPAPDLQPDVFMGPVWLPYSEHQLLALVSAVYQGALEAYAQLVRTWFPRFASRLSTAVFLPARLRACVAPSERGHPPIISWYLDPLPAGSSTTVDVQPGNRPVGFADLHQAHRDLLAVRGDVADRIRVRACNGVLHVFQPDAATTLAYSWLWDDLRDLKWVDGIFSS